MLVRGEGLDVDAICCVGGDAVVGGASVVVDIELDVIAAVGEVDERAVCGLAVEIVDVIAEDSGDLCGRERRCVQVGADGLVQRDILQLQGFFSEVGLQTQGAVERGELVGGVVGAGLLVVEERAVVDAVHEAAEHPEQVGCPLLVRGDGPDVYAVGGVGGDAVVGGAGVIVDIELDVVCAVGEVDQHAVRGLGVEIVDLVVDDAGDLRGRERRCGEIGADGFVQRDVLQLGDCGFGYEFG